MKQLFFSLLFVGAAGILHAQDQFKLPALSPNAKITQEFSTSSIEVSYSRPSMRGRKIFGDVIQYGAPWRTGANAPTKIKFGEDVTIGGKDIKAGEYALYTIPHEDRWEIIINKGTGNFGPDGFDKAGDVARFRIESKPNEKTQTFTIDITDITLSTCNIELMWEKTKIVIPVVANNKERLDAAIDKAINNPSLPYQQAANYYYETDQYLDKANEYMAKALEQNPNNFTMWNLKARIEKKLGHKSEAIEDAKKSIETAKGTTFERDYIQSNNKLIRELQ